MQKLIEEGICCLKLLCVLHFSSVVLVPHFLLLLKREQGEERTEREY
jgi:hypothetical protein